VPKSIKRILREHLNDLLAILAIIVKELIVAVAILASGWVLLELSARWSPHGGWSAEVIKALSELFAILAFVVLAIRDLWRYPRTE
jgi:hypothetical protein